MSRSKKVIIIVAAVVAVIAVAAAVSAVYLTTPADLGTVEVSDVPEKADGTTRVISFNLRCASDENESIKDRSALITAILNEYAPDSFGVQEATPRWLKILDKALGDKYARVGQARDRFGLFTEYSCVYYRTDKYNLIDSGTIWLSETPEKKYTGSFDTACKRVATWAVLEDKETGVKYTHLNTHLDHVLESTRVGQAGVLLEKLAELQKETKTVVCTGDFNADKTSEVYAKMLEATDDTRLTAKETDDGITYHDYGEVKETENGAIDFIFVTKDTEVERYKIIDNIINGMYPSDHYAICSDIYIK